MATQGDHHSSDETSSSLGDSAYEILGESVILTSEDEEHDDNTDSLASVDGHGSDDVASIADTEESTESHETASTSSHAEPDGIPTYGGLDRHAEEIDITGSAMTTKGDSRPSSPWIEFKEPHMCYGAEQVAVIHTVCHFNEQESQEVLQHMRLDSSVAQVTATIRQTMTKQSLAIDEPFRVLYIGNPSAKDDIVAKIGKALAVPVDGTPGPYAANGRSSRYNVVPISSFGDGSSPEVELIDCFGPELVVDECTSARTVKVKGTQDTLLLTLNGHVSYESRHDGSGFRLDLPDHRKLPNIAIFFRSDNDEITTRQTRLYGRPAEKYSLDHRSVHMCLESRGLSVTENRVLMRMPIDLSTFLNIDAGQMNRNLACLTGLYAGRENSQPTKSTRDESSVRPSAVPEDIEKSPYNSFGLAQSVYYLRDSKRPGLHAVLIPGFLLMCALALGLYTLPYQMFAGRVPASDVAGLHTSPLSVATPTTKCMAFPTGRSIVESTSAPAKLATSSKSLSLMGPKMDIESLLFNSSAMALNESDKFQLQVIGDNHMVLKPPHRYNVLKRAPKFSIKITRNNASVPYQLSKLFDGVYALKLNREEAYGAMNISVQTKSKPIIDQAFELDFGTPWLKLAGWKKAALKFCEHFQTEAKTAQKSVQTTFGQISIELQVVANHATKRAKMIQREAVKLEEASLLRALESKAIVSVKVKRISDILSRRTGTIRKQLLDRGHILSEGIVVQASGVSNALSCQLAKLYQTTKGVDVARLWNDVTSLRRTDTVRKAQRQALRLWSSGSGEQGKRGRMGKGKVELKGKKAGKKTRKNCNR
ncbi:MAG: hypothetical protein M1827_001473 [Pycnora praestabilis]|nr:MAG: hypothetical protein M1827_001473 [Pycnora praestabilis]